MTTNEAATGEADRLRSELDSLRRRAAELAEVAEGREAALRIVGERHAQQLKEAYELGQELGQAAQKAQNEAHNQAREDELTRLRAEFLQRDALLQTVLSSLSWRITRPLRVMRRLGSRIVSRSDRASGGAQ